MRNSPRQFPLHPCSRPQIPLNCTEPCLLGVRSGMAEACGDSQPGVCGIAARTAARTSSALGHGLFMSFAMSPPFREATNRSFTKISNWPCRPFSSSTGCPTTSPISAAKLAAFFAVVVHVSQYTIRTPTAGSIATRARGDEGCLAPQNLAA